MWVAQHTLIQQIPCSIYIYTGPRSFPTWSRLCKFGVPTASISTLGLRLLVHRITWHCKATQKKPLHNKQSLTWNPLISITITLIILLVNPKSGPCYSEQWQPYSQQPSSSLLQTSQDKKYIQDQGRGWTCFLFLSFQLKLQKTAWLYVKIQPVGNPRILVQTNKQTKTKTLS